MKSAAPSRRRALRAIAAFAALAFVVLFSGNAGAVDKRVEAQARAAIKAAAADYAANDYAQGILRLRKASKACGTSACGAMVRAELLRDIGVLQLAGGDTDKASASFLEALLTESSVDWNPAYDKPDLRAEWEAAKDEAAFVGRSQPSGDFVTTPAPEQVVHTAVPVYVEYGGTLAKVVVKYRSTGMKDYKKVQLSRMGKGWGGQIPCGDVVRGVVRYYVQGLDESDTPLALTGDPRHPLFVPIRWSITSAAPHLPDKPPPVQCGATGQCPAGTACGESHAEVAAPTLDNGEACESDGQCTSGRCAAGRCVSERSPQGTGGGFVRMWFGVSASIDIVYLPSGSDVCLLNNTALPVNAQGYYCTAPYGSDFPSRASPAENSTLIKGQAGQAASGLQGGDVRILFSFDYAVTANLLVGGRFGYVAGSYPGAAAPRDGRGLAPPIDAEVRGTWVFGDKPLAREGFAPLVSIQGGVAKFDAATTVKVEVTNVAGIRPMVAWQIGGPAFAGLGAGVRYAFSPRVALTLALKAQFAFGAGFFPTLGPEAGLQYGF